ncbi:hypothetical protein J421_2984 [Gemmatirosa kalamazoonensis]|uniref:Uncharacterized protein n=1 Tax=Gemmatirosa kalamazoonensis TaxID=861299 RepID=W0RIB1_9BACT|nr:hypothetical protein [Gemmatirosa kalamazoonensis]AHG90521.1 hypothetical protein J421_2984 [Gemmatirosa kalamazoonensis]
MLSISRRRRTTDRPRRSRGALAASFAVNALLLAAFLKGVSEGLRWTELFERGAPPVVERIGFVELPKATGAPVAGRAGGDGRPVTRRPAPNPAPAAPTTVPDQVPAVNPQAAPTETGGAGAVVGGGGATEGIRPTYTDGRLWAPSAGGSAPLLSPQRSKERIDSVMAETFGAARDSILAEQQALASARKPGDWTVNGPGGKWGMDQSSIHLGKIAIPNAILALLSSNVQQQLRGNPIQMAEDRRLANVRADLMQHAQREQGEDMLRAQVKEIRARKDRERAARMADQQQRAQAPSTPDK